MDGEFRRFVRVLTDCHGVGFVVMVNHRDFHGNAASYDVGTTYDGGIMTCKNLTPGQVHAVPADLTLAHRLTPDGPPARLAVAHAVDDGTLQRLFDAYEPDPDDPAQLHYRQVRYAFAQAAERLDWKGMADAMASLPRPARLLPSCALLNWAVDVVDAAVGGMTMPAMPRGLDGERKRAEARLNAIMPTGIEAIVDMTSASRSVGSTLSRSDSSPYRFILAQCSLYRLPWPAANRCWASILPASMVVDS